MIAGKPLLLNKNILSFSQPGVQHHHTTKGNVLLAGQNKEELALLTGYLHDTYQLLTATNGYGVMKIIEAQCIQLVIVNIILSDIDGAQLCAHLKSSPHYSHIPVILLVEKDTVLSRVKSLEAGADACMEKPLCRQVTMAQVNNVIANRARIKNYFANTLFAHMDNTPGTKTNEVFVKSLNQCITENLPDKYFDIDCLAKQMNMSRPTLYRKIKCISDMSPNELINAARLKKAADLLLASDYNVSEIVKMVGFNSRSNFGKAFFKKYNSTPTGYQQLKKRV
jgi:two-component system cell cycle response regulator